MYRAYYNIIPKNVEITARPTPSQALLRCLVSIYMAGFPLFQVNECSFSKLKIVRKANPVMNSDLQVVYRVIWICFFYREVECLVKRRLHQSCLCLKYLTAFTTSTASVMPISFIWVQRQGTWGCINAEQVFENRVHSIVNSHQRWLSDKKCEKVCS